MRRLTGLLLLGALCAHAIAAEEVTLPKVTARAKGSRLGGIRPNPQPCPEGIPKDVQCLVGQDYLGAWYWLARPQHWNGVLVLHAPDGPELQDPDPDSPARAMARWRAWLKAGYAWAASSYRSPGWDADNAAEDSERVRQSFITEWEEPQFVLLHGHGWGAAVATRMAEHYTTPDIHPRRGSSGKPPYDGVLLTNGQLAGVRAFDHWLDLRVIYQAICGNHPRPLEQPYPLWMGLPLDTKLTEADLAARVDECTGLQQPAANRTAAQKKNLANIVRLARVTEPGLLPQLRVSTWGLQHLIWQQLNGKNPLGNEGVQYGGSADKQLNDRLPRYKIDAVARAALTQLTEPHALLHRPTVSMHASNDPLAFVEYESYWRDAMTESGTASSLLQLFFDSPDHEQITDKQLTAMARLLADWARTGQKPPPTAARTYCADCHWLFDFSPPGLDMRIPVRRPSPSRQTAPQVLTTPPANPVEPEKANAARLN